jgi:hypothetical protein
MYYPLLEDFFYCDIFRFSRTISGQYTYDVTKITTHCRYNDFREIICTSISLEDSSTEPKIIDVHKKFCVDGIRSFC